MTSTNQLEGGISEMMATLDYEPAIGTDMYKEEVINVDLPEGVRLSVDAMKIQISSESISNKTYQPRVEFQDENIKMIDGEFVSGVDFPAGVYSIKAVSGNGTISTSNPFNGGLIAMMGEFASEDYMFQDKCKIISLPKDTTLLIEFITEVELIPVR